MSIKVIATDAQRVFAKKIGEITESIASMEKTKSEYPLGAAILEHKTQKSIEDHRRGLAALQAFLGNHAIWTKCMSEPVLVALSNPQAAKGIFGVLITGSLFLFENAFYEIRGPFSEEDGKMLIRDFVARRRRKIDFLRSRDSAQGEARFERRPISEEVRHEVWRRDEGKCVVCGSVRDLEFDHIIPIARGGGNTARNIQLLCEACNRQKSDEI